MIMKNTKIFSALCVVIFLSSCGGGGGSSSPIAPPPVTQNPSGLACASYQTNTRKCSFTHNGVLREYYVYTPSSYTPSSNAPLPNNHGSLLTPFKGCKPSDHNSGLEGCLSK